MYPRQSQRPLTATFRTLHSVTFPRPAIRSPWHRVQPCGQLPSCRRLQSSSSSSTSTSISFSASTSSHSPTQPAELFNLPPWFTSLHLPRSARIALAMSGGVDSALCAYLLSRHPHVSSVTGIYMRNWDAQDETGICTSDADWAAVRQACRTLGIPCERLDFVSEYWGRVFEEHTLDAYARGWTPNPDVWCNREIKFGAMYDRVFGQHGSRFDLLATGHYARTRVDKDGRVQLARAADGVKDQSYFLAAVQGEVLPQVLFPLGGVESKAEVKALARQVGLTAFADKKESMGICFIGKRKRFGDFLDGYMNQQPGNFVLQDGTVLGPHLGLAKYTIGQSAKLASQPVKYFVARKSPTTGDILLVPDSNHPLLYTCRVRVKWINWIHPENEHVALNGPGLLTARVRYQQQAVACRVVRREVGQGGGMYEMEFDEPVRAVTPGQVLVLYAGDVCLGCGIQVDDLEP